MKPTRKTKPALWTKVPGAKPVVSADRAEFSHGPRLAGKPWTLARTAKSFMKALRAVKAKPIETPGAIVKSVWKEPRGVRRIKDQGNGRRIKAVSTARAKQLREYAKLKREWMKCQSMCKGCGMYRRGSLDLHHGRGRNGRLLCMTEFWIPLCRECHDKIKTDPAWAYANGLLAPKGQYNTIPK